MSDNGIVIRQIITDSSAAVNLATATINANQDRIDTLNKNITAVKEGICDVASQRLKTYLLSFYGINISLFVYGVLYNNVYDITGNLTDWRVLQVVCDNGDPYSIHFIPINDYQFFTYNDTSNLFIPRLNFADIAFGRKNQSGIIINQRPTNIMTAIYDTSSNITTVSVSDHVIDVSDNIIYLYRAGFNDPVDSTADEFVVQWSFAHDYLIQPQGMNGTYGLIPQRDNLLKGNSIVSSNKDKNEQIPNMFESYT